MRERTPKGAGDPHDAAPGGRDPDAALDAAARAARELRARLGAGEPDATLPPLPSASGERDDPDPPRAAPPPPLAPADPAPGQPAAAPAARLARVVAGRFATLGELRGLELALGRVAGVADVHVTSLWSGWAELELRLDAPLALGDELRALAPAGALVRRAAHGAHVVELAPDDPALAVPVGAVPRRAPRARPPELAAGGPEAVRTSDPADRDRALVLALGTGSAFWSLRGVRPEPALLEIVPLAVAERALALPLLLAPGWLTVAAAAPEPDLGPLAARFPHLRVEVVIAARAELREALALARGAGR